MKNSIIIAVLMMITLSVYAQGIGLTRNELFHAKGDNFYESGLMDNGLEYLTFSCKKDFACYKTNFILDQDIVVLVMDVFTIDKLEYVLKYLNSSFASNENSSWNDPEDDNLISLIIDNDYRQFMLIYTSLNGE